MAVDKNGKPLPGGVTWREKEGRYMGRFRFNGIRYCVYGKDVKSTIDKMEDMKYELKHGIYCKEDDITVSGWFHVWIKEYKEPTVKRGTIGVYHDNFNSYIDKPFGKRKLKDIRPEMIQKLYNDLNNRGYSRNTLEIVCAVLNGMYKQAVKNQIVRSNPVPLATLPRTGRPMERRVMTVEEQKIFLGYAEEGYLHDMFVIALATGMRSGELRGLEWKDIDFRNRVIHVTGTLVYLDGEYYKDTPKTETSKRDIPMLENVCSLLKARKRKQSELRLYLGSHWKAKEGLEGLVFTTETGYPMNRDMLKQEINLTLDRIHAAGIEFEHITPHTFRHTFATRCIEQGMPPQVLKTILGHSKLSMTMDLYSHVLPNTKAEEIKKIQSLF